MLGGIVSISDLSIYCAIRNGSADPRLGHVPNPNSLLIGIHPPEWTDLIWTSPALFGGPLTLGTWGKLPPRRQHCPYCQRRPACWTKRKTTPHYYSSWRLYTSATLIASHYYSSWRLYTSATLIASHYYSSWRLYTSATLIASHYYSSWRLYTSATLIASHYYSSWRLYTSATLIASHYYSSWRLYTSATLIASHYYSSWRLYTSATLIASHYYSSWRLYTSATLIASWSTETRALPFQNTDNWSWTMLHGSHSTLRKMRKLLQHKKYPSIQNAWRPKHYK